jgi:hypothetical protein
VRIAAIATKGNPVSDVLSRWLSAPVCAASYERAMRFWAGEGRYLISVQTLAYDYRKNFDEPAARRLIPRHLEVQAALPGLNLPGVLADWGTVSTARYWGGEVTVEGDFVHIAPAARTLDEALALTPRPVDDPTMDARRGLDRWRAIAAELNTDQLWLRTPDLQGALNTAGLVMDQEALLVAMALEPERVHEFLARVCDFLIDYVRYLRRETTGRICGNIWPPTFFPAELGVALTEDLMPLLSAPMYREFGIPLLRRMAGALGGLHIHCCGRWGHQVNNLKESGLPIRAMEFHYPFTKIEELEPLAGSVVFVPYIMLHMQREYASVTEYYRALIEQTDSRFRFWFACADDLPETLEFAQAYAPG